MIPIRVLIADDHTLVREGLRQLLNLQADIQVIGEASDGLEAVELTRKLRPDILLIDLAMPRLGGIEAARLVRDAVPETRVVVLTMFQKEGYAHQVLNAGAYGYVLKGSPSADLLEALRTVHGGRYYLSHPMQAQVIDSYLKTRENTTPPSEFDLLSEREKQVFLLIIEGNSTAQIGKLLCVSPKTIEKHRANIALKIGLSNPVEMMKYAIRLGIVEPEHWST
jgi:two-component system response regulator NreC